MGLRLRKAYNLTERDIRFAMKNSTSNLDAARFMKINYTTYRKYAKMYTDEETGKTLYDMHMYQRGVHHNKGSKTHHGMYGGLEGLMKILNGEHPEYRGKELKKRIVKEGVKAEECELCGFDNRREADYIVPLLLVWVDGDRTNHRLDNLLLICHNCYRLHYYNIIKERNDHSKDLPMVAD